MTLTKKRRDRWTGKWASIFESFSLTHTGHSWYQLNHGTAPLRARAAL